MQINHAVPKFRIYSSGSCEEIGHRIKVATVVRMGQPLDCKREPITRSSPPGSDRSFPTDFENRGTDEKYTNGYVHYIAARPFLAGYVSSVPGLPYFEDDPAR